MSGEHYYKVCCDHMGQDVEITDREGKVYVGKIERVDREYVYIREERAPQGGHQGPGLFFFPLALGALVAIPLIGIAGFRRRPYY
ncbi:hypothetical protein [Evansella tamaricis]|uniref:Uncharacterized protein n=1 Tax=Evansella tamaricis TaxID=2069301 RepID=A0ABS6JDQ8_9BACI|nr:hypothetical protein [Evansella tamaricis]MBU9711786.1 hypothetical protein [Evansella tamaricis]